MKRRLLSAFLAVMMVLTMAPMAFAAGEGETNNDTGSAAAEPVAQVGETGYATFAKAVEAVQDGGTVTLLKDVQLESLFAIHKNLTLDLGGKTLSRAGSVLDLYGNVTIKNGTITTTGAGTGAVWMNQTAKLTVEDDVTMTAPDDSFAIGYYQDCTAAEVTFKGTITGGNGITMNGLIQDTGTNNKLVVDGAKITVSGQGIYQAGYSETAFSVNNSTISGSTGIEVRAGKLNVTNSVISGSGEFKCVPHGNGGTTDGAGIAIAQHTTKLPIEVTISDGEISGPYAIYESNPQNNDAESIAKVKLSVTGGKFNGPIYSKDIKGFISGGYFTVDPTDYCVSGKIGLPNTDAATKDAYPFIVGEVVENVEPAPAAPEAKADTTGKESKVADAMTAAVSAITGENNKTVVEGLDTVANVEASKVTLDAVNAASTALTNADVDITNETVTVYVQPYLDITVTNAKVNYDNQNAPIAVTMDIVPMVKKVASTATDAENIKLTGDEKNAVVLGTPEEVAVDTSVTLTLPLPENFTTNNDSIKVKHEKNGKFVCYHAATYNETDKTVTFTNDKGFSTFTVLNDSRDFTVQYTDKDGANEGAEVTYTALNIGDKLPTTTAPSGKVFSGWKFEDEDVSGTYTALTEDLLDALGYRTQTIKATPVFTSKSSGSSSGGSSSGKTTYKVTTSAVNNGGVNASPSTAEKGATITITLSPDKGYKLGKLTVTDGSGKTVSTVKKSDTVYTFTMPASAVTVGVSYVKTNETPSETKFNDVSANDWFASAVDYVTDRGMMNGTGTNTFGPKANTTRGMVVTVLYRLENEPSTAAASFTDVASGAYYANAVAWANANGIVSGYGNGKFGPNDKVTREQLAAILYRYAQYKKYDVSVGEDTNIMDFDDVRQISSYAVPAIQWACGAGVMSGKSTYTLDPKGDATRAEVAAMLMRFCENVK